MIYLIRSIIYKQHGKFGIFKDGKRGRVMNRKQKGARSERKTMDYLEARGYYCTKSAGSLGEWDIIGVSEDGVVLVQVKSNNWPRPPEM